jgi:hypothetical protein
MKKVAENEYWFSVESVQENRHYCTASGTAKFIDGRYVYVGEGSLSEPDLVFFVQGKAIRFSGSQELCGARAFWESVGFPLSALKSRKAKECVEQ